MFKGHIFVLFFICICHSSYSFEELFDIGKEVWKLYSMLDKIEQSFDNSMELSEAFSDENKEYRGVVNQIREIHQRLDIIERSGNFHFKTLQTSFAFLVSTTILHSKVEKIRVLTSRIARIHEEFRLYIERGAYFPHTMDNIATEVAVELEANILFIRSFFISRTESGRNWLFQVARYGVQQVSSICGGTQTISYALYHLYEIVIIAEIKAAIVLSYAYMYQFYKNRAFKISDWITGNEFATLFANYVGAFSLVLDVVDPLYLRACDPQNGTWIRNTNFYEMEGTFQVTIFRYHWYKCKYNSCNYIKSNRPTNCPATDYDTRSSCPDISTGCAYLSAIDACVLKDGPYKFQYVNSSQLGPLGRNFTCPKDKGYLIKDGSGLGATFATCACNCNGKHNKISLSIRRSNERSNMVIIGLRFYRKDNILYIQPREGKLQTNGLISPGSAQWVRIRSSAAGSKIRTIDNQHRLFFLDDVRLPPNYALTGVKFSEVTRGTTTGFAIEIFGVAFDDRTGKLDRRDSISRRAPDGGSLQGVQFDRVSSIHTTLAHRLSSTQMKYVQLDRSELWHDFGQSTVPFFDAVPVLTEPSSALSGFGIIHKGAPGHAGFISLKLYAIHYARYFIDFDIAHVKKGRVIFSNSTNDST